MSTLRDSHAKERLREALWYGWGRVDALRELAPTTHQPDVFAFSEYANGEAKDYRAERRSSLPSIRDQWQRFALISEWSERGAGPGKYEGNAFPAAAAYVSEALSLAGGCAEENGSVTEYGSWHGLIYLSFAEQETVIALGWERDSDADDSARPVAAIVAEDSIGFVGVTFYDSEDGAQSDWTEVLALYEDDSDDEDDSEHLWGATARRAAERRAAERRAHEDGAS